MVVVNGSAQLHFVMDTVKQNMTTFGTVMDAAVIGGLLGYVNRIQVSANHVALFWVENLKSVFAASKFVFVRRANFNLM